MKKFYFILFAIIFTLSCNKETAETGLQQNDQKEFLTFKTVSEYESTISLLSSKTDDELKDWCKKNNPNALLNNMTEEELENIGIFDDILAALLNNESIISIGKNVYQIDLLNENVKCVQTKNYTSTKNFLNKNMSKQYSTTQDVLYIEEYGIDDDENSNKKGCRDGCGRLKYGPIFYTKYAQQVKREMSYQKAGVYFSLVAEMKIVNLIGCGGTTTIGMQSNLGYGNAPSDCRFVKKSDCNEYWLSSYDNGGNCHKYTHRPYSSSRGLHKYRFSVYFYAYDAVSSYPGWHDFHTLTCRY